MASDIVERLRAAAAHWRVARVSGQQVCSEAADEIERLRSETELWKATAQAEAEGNRLHYEEVLRLRSERRALAERCFVHGFNRGWDRAQDPVTSGYQASLGRAKLDLDALLADPAESDQPTTDGAGEGDGDG